MILLKDSHTDHVSKEIVDYVLGLFKAKQSFFIETIELPDGLGLVECGLYGPAAGDLAVWEMHVWHAKRPGRSWMSRLINKPPRQTKVLTVVAGPYGGHPCVLYTVYGGPVAPRELDDPSLTNIAEYEAAKAFWAEHALSGAPQ